jgi:hypothetical protein
MLLQGEPPVIGHDARAHDRCYAATPRGLADSDG